MIKKTDIKDIYPLSSMQEGMLFYYLKDKEKGFYFEQAEFIIHGEIKKDLLEKSFNYLIEKYDVLRTVFIHKKVKSPLQVVLKKKKGTVTFKDMSKYEKSDQEKLISELKKSEKDRGFELEKDLLMRFILIKESEKNYRLIWNFHHIIIDGWCIGIILKELFGIYEALLKNEKINEEKAPSYGKYIRWLKKQNTDEAKKYWKEYLLNYSKPSKFPIDNHSNEFTSSEKIIYVSKEKTANINSLSKSKNITVSSLFQACFGLLLKQSTNNNKVTFGTVVSGRPYQITNVEKMVGLFLNTIPMKIDYTNRKRFIDTAREIQKYLLESNKYHYLPLSEIQKQSRLKSELINHIIAFENYPLGKELDKLVDKDKLGFSIEKISMHEKLSYDLSLQVIPKEEMIIKILYNEDKYKENTIDRIEKQMQLVLDQLIDDKDILTRDIELIDTEEKDKILSVFNEDEIKIESQKTIMEIFETEVKKNPKKIALKYGLELMTYERLNKKANKLAHKLIENGIKKNDFVGIMIDRSFEMIIGILGILKAGGVFVPIDPKYPEARKKYILKDSQCQLLITDQNNVSELGLSMKIFDLNSKNSYSKKDSNPNIELYPKDLMYIIYTSGSTGNPKGVLVNYGNVSNTLKYLQKEYPLDEEGCYLLKTSFTFDVSITEIFGWFFDGGSLGILDPEDEKDPSEIYKAILNFEVTHINFTPSMLKIFLDYSENHKEAMKSLKYIFSAGEAISKEIINNYKKLNLNCKLENLYGPTEATIYATKFSLDNEVDSINVPIGKPLTNTQAYILDENINLLPVGMIGELCLAGAGISQGYLNREKLTREKFIDNPFGEGKLYKTGDLARWLPDGNIEYIGRIDNQVKIRGFRIELGEIKNKLLKIDGIKEGVVTAHQDNEGNKFLIAYYITTKDLKLNEIKDQMKLELPDYMIPSYFIQLDTLPLTLNGKIDRKSLPDIEEFELSSKLYEEPDNKMEEDIIKVWESTLEVENIGRSTNFFDIGGDSLKAIRVAVELQKNYDMKIADLFDYPTPKELAKNINLSKNNLQEKIEFMKNGIAELEQRYKERMENRNIKKEILKYEEKIKKYESMDYTAKKNLKKIMITGATGFLGAHLVNEFLENTKCEIYCIVRGKNQEHAEMRLSEKLDYYFGEGYFRKNFSRMKILKGDLSEEKLGLKNGIYKKISNEIEMIINSAANVRHFGPYEKFYKANVESVKNIVEFSKVGMNKDIYHISTTSVLMGETQYDEDMLFTEFDMDIGQKSDNVYVKSKFEAEKNLLDEMLPSNNINILRVGNIVYNSKTKKFQENSQENAFYNFLKSLKNLGMVPKINFKTLEFSYVDYMAMAIRKISMCKTLKNEIHHIYNNNTVSLKKIGKWDDKLEIKTVDDFFKTVIKNIDSDYKGDINNIIIHSNLINHIKENKILVNKKTKNILNKLGFKWKKPENKDIESMIN